MTNFDLVMQEMGDVDRDFTNNAKADELARAMPTDEKAGPVITNLVAMLKKLVATFGNNLPAILAALQAAGIVLPGWAGILLQILVAFAPAKTSTDETV